MDFLFRQFLETNPPTPQSAAPANLANPTAGSTQTNATMGQMGVVKQVLDQYIGTQNYPRLFLDCNKLLNFLNDLKSQTNNFSSINPSAIPGLIMKYFPNLHAGSPIASPTNVPAQNTQNFATAS